MMAVTAVALAGLHGCLCLSPPILRERAMLFIDFVKLTLIVSSHVSLAGARVDQFAVVSLPLCTFRSHRSGPFVKSYLLDLQPLCRAHLRTLANALAILK
jgi:hypothetical protein